MDRHEIGQRLLQARNSLGLSQAAFAEKLGVSQSKIAKLEHGKLPIEMKELSEYEQLLGLEGALLPVADVPAGWPECAAYSLGLRELAADVQLCAVLELTAEEGAALCSAISGLAPIDKAGAVQLLFTLRAIGAV